MQFGLILKSRKRLISVLILNLVYSIFILIMIIMIIIIMIIFFCFFCFHFSLQRHLMLIFQLLKVHLRLFINLSFSNINTFSNHSIPISVFAKFTSLAQLIAHLGKQRVSFMPRINIIDTLFFIILVLMIELLNILMTQWI